MRPEDLGYNNIFEEYRIKQKLENFETGRIIAEHKERYIVKTPEGEFEAEITGNMRFSAKSREDFPIVGDWVALATYESGFAIIHDILPRFSIIGRQAAGRKGEIQPIAANIDYAFLVQAVDRDFNLNRLERYLTICHSSGVRPIIILSKSDLADESRLKATILEIKARISDVPVIAISNLNLGGFEEIRSVIKPGKTYCLLGSSGVGKSTLINNLAGKNLMKTDAISQSTNKGRHVTSHRELLVLDNGGILIDNPGMREVGIADSSGGLEITFDKIARLSQSCRFKDCTHTTETGCSVIDAIENGDLDSASYENYLKMYKEQAFFESTIAERRRRDRIFGKIIKNYKKGKG